MPSMVTPNFYVKPRKINRGFNYCNGVLCVPATGRSRYIKVGTSTQEAYPFLACQKLTSKSEFSVSGTQNDGGEVLQFKVLSSRASSITF